MHSVNYSSFTFIIWSHFNSYFISRKNFNEMYSHFSRKMAKYESASIYFYPKQRVWQYLSNYSNYFNRSLVCHTSHLSPYCNKFKHDWQHSISHPLKNVSRVRSLILLPAYFFQKDRKFPRHGSQLSNRLHLNKQFHRLLNYK